MKLRHLSLPALARYSHASQLQDTLVSSFLGYKQAVSANERLPPTPISLIPPTNPGQPFQGDDLRPPPPTVITAEFQPVYTCGRREVDHVSEATQQYLRADGKAEFHAALRGGQTTFHGPGQLTAYPILDIRALGLTPKCYVRALEKSVISTLAHYDVRGFTTENPGVWTSDLEKICAVGVHMRRYISSHGIGLNVSTDMAWFNRIVACGLEGKSASSMQSVGVDVVGGVEEVTNVFVKELAREVGLTGVALIREEDIFEDEW